MKKNYYLAELNIAKMVAPLESPVMKEFVDFLDPVNKLGEESPGFVWRYKSEEGASSAYVESSLFGEMMIVNMTVWKDLESLREFTYKTVHSYFLKSRSRWFEKMSGHQVVLWWVPAGHYPTLEEGRSKLDLLEQKGPTQEAFTLNKVFSFDEVEEKG